VTHATGARDFAAIVEARAAERPNAVAVAFAGTDTTWAALVERVQRLAAALRAAGIAPGDRIAVLDLNHPSAVELTLACAQIGAANAVVNFRLAPPELVYVITDARARILFVGPEFSPVVDGLRADLTTAERVVRSQSPCRTPGRVERVMSRSALASKSTSSTARFSRR